MSPIAAAPPNPNEAPLRRSSAGKSMEKGLAHGWSRGVGRGREATLDGGGRIITQIRGNRKIVEGQQMNVKICVARHRKEEEERISKTYGAEHNVIVRLAGE